jgi:cytochrome P450
VAERHIHDWPRGDTFSIYPRMQAITLEVIVRAVFGIIDPGLRRQLHGMLSEVLTQVSSPSVRVQIAIRSLVPPAGPLPPGFRRLLDRVDRVLLAEIAERRTGDCSKREDVMSMLVAARFEDGSGMSDQEVRNQLMTVLVAGAESTAVTLSWILDMLLRNPEVLSRLAGSDGDEDYMRAVTWEALRLRPPVIFTGRRLKSDLQAGKYTLPAGIDAVTLPLLTHSNPDIYPDPLAFRPERFLGRRPSTYEWIPFGGGARRCLGAAFAESEIEVILNTIIDGISLRPVGPRPELLNRNTTVSPRRGTRVQAVDLPGRYGSGGTEIAV